MVYTFMNYDDFNSKYNDILKIATCYSENFSFFYCETDPQKGSF